MPIDIYHIIRYMIMYYYCVRYFSSMPLHLIVSVNRQIYVYNMMGYIVLIVYDELLYVPEFISF